MTVTSQIRRNALLIVVIVAALVLIAIVVMFFNRRIEKIETRRQAPQSQNMESKPLFIIPSTSRS